jgi:hypothetical protein
MLARRLIGPRQEPPARRSPRARKTNVGVPGVARSRSVDEVEVGGEGGGVLVRDRVDHESIRKQ